MNVETKKPAATTTHSHAFGLHSSPLWQVLPKLRETKSSQPAILHHVLTTACRNILSLKNERDEENWAKSCEV